MSDAAFPECVHIMAIGGAHMSAIAQILHARGHQVSGCDARPSPNTERLESLGVPVAMGHAPEHLAGTQMLIVSAAIREGEDELVTARRSGLPVLTRAQAVGQLMEGKIGVAIAGTHGKTTTTSLVTFILAKAGLDPEYLVGGDVRNLGSNAGAGSGRHVVVEADEYADAFLEYRPAIAVLLNVEEDHLNYFGSLERIRASFRHYLANVAADGVAIVCADDAQAASLVADPTAEPPIRARIERYGLRGGADWGATEITPNELGGSSFTVTKGGRVFGAFRTQLPGSHNVLNAIAGVAAGHAVSVELRVLQSALEEFLGAGRRFQAVGEAQGITIIDDYAHHPTEVAALLKAARGRFPGRRIVILFQPHTYSRTAYMFDAFTRCFEDADLCLILATDGDRETAEAGRTSLELVEKVTTPRPLYLESFEEMRQRVPPLLQAGDVLFTVGAGEVKKAGGILLAELQGR